MIVAEADTGFSFNTPQIDLNDYMIDALLADEGACSNGRSQDFMGVVHILGIKLDHEDLDAAFGDPDAVMEIKDKILTDLDTRLTKILNL
jgi:hypothetical protein